MTFSSFIAYFAANRRYIAASVAEQIRREAKQRVTERQKAGRGDYPLDFTDLARRMEDAIM